MGTRRSFRWVIEDGLGNETEIGGIIQDSKSAPCYQHSSKLLYTSPLTTRKTVEPQYPSSPILYPPHERLELKKVSLKDLPTLPPICSIFDSNVKSSLELAPIKQIQHMNRK